MVTVNIGTFVPVISKFLTTWVKFGTGDHHEIPLSDCLILSKP